ncbi:hypothetical protein B9Z55_016616 [Caenorhabditis nigoni]|uniref:ZP domain-containing protein n=2 Tax=Caenorhabditis nigoni TaxID=1611254 RepID=A0A2G5T627_9PELO|nr:hypothetical protein B9Z55_016616 [Caenorhabditis nigoni]
MMTWQWIFFAAIIMVANGSACHCSIPPVLFPFTNDKYTDKWWSNIKNETQASYNSSFFVDIGPTANNILENGCSVSMSCILFYNRNITLVQTTIIVVTSDNQRHDFPFTGAAELKLNCNHDGQYTHKGVPFDIQVAGCMGIQQMNKKLRMNLFYIFYKNLINTYIICEGFQFIS